MGRVLRQWRIWSCLQRSRDGCSIADLAGFFGGEVCERTLRRDLDALEAAGVPLRRVRRGRGVRWILTRPAPTRADRHTLAALRLALAALPIAGTPLWDALDALREEVERALPRALWDEAAALDGALVAIGPARVAGRGPVLERVVEALARHRVLLLQHPGEGSLRVHPQALACDAGALFLVALTAPARAPRVFRLDEIEAIGLLDEEADALPEGELAALLSESRAPPAPPDDGHGLSISPDRLDRP